MIEMLSIKIEVMQNNYLMRLAALNFYLVWLSGMTLYLQ
jgi:hypothetical protein